MVKGTNFVDIRDAGDPVELAVRYDAEGADELVFLDITATHERRDTVAELARRTADDVFIPFTIGGGIRSVADAQAVLDAGADKVERQLRGGRAPGAAGRAERRTSARSASCSPWTPRRATPRGRRRAGRRTSRAGAPRPAATRSPGAARPSSAARGRSCSRAWTATARATATTCRSRRAVAEAVAVPVIASGGAGTLDHLVDALRAGADAVLCASIFHYGQFTVGEAKAHLAAAGIAVRPAPA